MGFLWSEPNFPEPGLLDRLLRPEFARQQEEKMKMQKEDLASEILRKRNEAEEWTVKKEQADTAMKQQKMIMDSLEKSVASGVMTKEQAGSVLMDPKGLGATLYQLTQWANPKKSQEPPTQTLEQTGEFFRPTEQMVKQQPSGLASQIANQQLSGGIDMSRLMQDVMMNKLGYPMENPQSPVRTEPMLNPQTKKWEMGQILRNGGIKWTGQEVPQKIQWVDEIHPQTQMVFKAAYDDYGNRQPQFDRGNVPQNTQFVGGAIGNQPAQIALPPGGVAPGTAFPGAVNLQTVPTTGPRGETGVMQINPYGGGVPSIGGRSAVKESEIPGLGIQTGAAKAPPVPQAQQISMMRSGLDGLKKAKDAIFDPRTGKINRPNLGTGTMNVPWTEGKRAVNILGTALNAIRLASTGAAFSEEELEQLKSQYIPTVWGNDQQIYDQWDLLTKFVYSMLSQMDPNEVFTPGIKKDFEKLMNIPKQGTQKAPGWTTYTDAGTEYEIPIDRVDMFLKDHPKAKRISP